MTDIFDSGAGVLNGEPSGTALPEGLDDEALLNKAREQFKLAEEAESDTRRESLDDQKFLAGDQWPMDIEQQRRLKGRPCLKINRLPQFTNQVCNDQKQNRPAIKVHPADGAASDETAKVIQGLIRHIENNSNAEYAYDCAFESAVEARLGYFRIYTDFASPDSFDQELYIGSIENPLSVFFDPHSRKLDGSDANFAFVTEDFSKDAYQALYPHSKLSTGASEWAAFGNTTPGWLRDNTVRVAEWFYKDYEDKTLHLMSTGETVEEGNLLQYLAHAQVLGFDVKPVKSRQVKVPVIRWCKINGQEILERTTWIGSYIPIIPVYGKRRFIENKRVLESLITHAKDPQRALNYWKSAQTEAIALAPKAPYVGYAGQFEGYEQEWQSANRENHAYLEVNPTTINGQLAPIPQRQAVEPAVMAITQATMQAQDDLKGTTGVFDGGMGQAGPEVSGVAIQKRNTQIQTSTYHFTDNLKHSMRHAGRILVEVIPKVYDTARAARIIGDDGTHKIVKLNQPTGEMGKDGKPLIYQLDEGRYDVTVDIGPSYASKREEASNSLMQFAQAMPQAAQYCSDLIARNMDWPGAQELADRLKKLLPPQLQDDGKNQQLPPQAQAQMQQMHQLIDSLTHNLNECTKVIETKKLDLEHRERVEIMKLQTNAEIELAKLGSREDVALLQAQLTEMEHRLSLLKISAPIEAPNSFDPSQADGGNYAGVGHIGGSENLTGAGPTPGSPMEGN